MDGTQGSKKSSELYARLCIGTASLVLDLRRSAAACLRSRLLTVFPHDHECCAGHADPMTPRLHGVIRCTPKRTTGRRPPLECGNGD